MGQVSKKAGSKGRKIGREKHHPSHVRYVATHQWIINKARKIARDMRNGKGIITGTIPDTVSLELRDAVNKLLKRK